MEELVQDVIKQVPALGVLAFIVIQFLKHMSTMGERAEKRSIEIHKDQMTCQERLGAVIEENTHALGRVEACIERCNGKQKG